MATTTTAEALRAAATNRSNYSKSRFVSNINSICDSNSNISNSSCDSSSSSNNTSSYRFRLSSNKISSLNFSSSSGKICNNISNKLLAPLSSK